MSEKLEIRRFLSVLENTSSKLKNLIPFFLRASQNSFMHYFRFLLSDHLTLIVTMLYYLMAAPDRFDCTLKWDLTV